MKKLSVMVAHELDVATLMPAAVQMFDGVSGISSDRMTLFVEKSYATSIMTRTSLSQPFTLPAGARGRCSALEARD